MKIATVQTKAPFSIAKNTVKRRKRLKDELNKTKKKI